MFKTGLLLAAITALFMAVGLAVGGEGGMMAALLFAVVTNAFTYWFSDSLVLKMHRAEPLDGRYPELQAMVERLSANAGIPTPKAYVIHNAQPNAFATGRSPSHAAVAVTTGLLERLEPHEVAAVIAHELGHIKNRDTLIMTITATLAGAIGALANFFMFFGHSNREGGPGPVAGLAMAILAPFMAMLVQLAISRTREYGADASGAQFSGDPLALASALEKIAAGTRHIPNPQAEAHPGTAHLFIMNPLSGRGVDSLFSTHPAPENRIRALRELAAKSSHRPTSSQTASPWGAQAKETPRPLKRGSFDF